MNKTVRIPAIMIVLLALQYLHTTAQMGTNQWQYNNPKPFGFLCYQLAYADNNNVVVVGEAGGIAKSTDAGATWQYFAYTTRNAAGEVSRPVFNDVVFATPLIGYAVGNDGIMIKTTDGGNNWSLVPTPFFATQQEINTVCFTSPTIGYIGGDGDPATRTSTMYKTTDGGTTWQPFYEFPAPGTEWINGTIYKIRFSPNGTGYVGGAGGQLWKWSNNTWQDYSITDSTVFPNVNTEDTVLFDNFNGGFDTVISTYDDNTFGLQYQNYRGIAVLNDSVVMVSTQNNAGLIRVNTANSLGSYLLLNNGSAMSPKYYTLGSPQIYNLATRNTVVAGAAEGGKLLISNDRGFSWESKPVYNNPNEMGIAFYGIDIAPSGRIGLCGQAGIVADSLTSWQRPYTFKRKDDGTGSFAIETIAFASATHGVVAGTGGGMYRTNNAGDTWDDISNASFNPWEYYSSVANPSPDIIMAAASNGLFFKSFDRGNTFDLLFTEPNAGRFDAMHFINADTGWLVANITYTDTVTFENTFHQKIYRSFDGGLSWDSSDTQFPFETNFSLNNYLYEIRFSNSGVGYAAGVNGSIFKSTDWGVTWAKLNGLPIVAFDKTISSLAVVDANTIFASGTQALVIKSLDGGATWTQINSDLPGGFARYPKILMNNSAQGLLFGQGAVYATNDGGANWTPYYVPNSSLLGAATFIPIPGCTTGACQKVMAGAGFSILKLDAGVVLPVKLSKLTGAAVINGNQLIWTAYDQSMLTVFEVEKSLDGQHFVKAGNAIYPGSLYNESYQWLDPAPAAKTFYRVKAIERSGMVYYTNIVVITSKTQPKWNHFVREGSLVLNNGNALNGVLTATVFNAAGQRVVSKNWNHQGGVFNQSMQLPATAKGWCVVQIRSQSQVYNGKIFVP